MILVPYETHDSQTAGDSYIFGITHPLNYIALLFSYFIIFMTVWNCAAQAPASFEIVDITREMPDLFNGFMTTSFAVLKDSSVGSLRVSLSFGEVVSSKKSVNVTTYVSYGSENSDEMAMEQSFQVIRKHDQTNYATIFDNQALEDERVVVNVAIRSSELDCGTYAFRVTVASEKYDLMLISFKVMLVVVVLGLVHIKRTMFSVLFLISAVPMEVTFDTTYIQCFLLVVSFRMLWIEKFIRVSQLKSFSLVHVSIRIVIVVCELGLLGIPLNDSLAVEMYGVSGLCHVFILFRCLFRVKERLRNNVFLSLPFVLFPYFTTAVTFAPELREEYMHSLTPTLVLLTSHMFAAAGLELMQLKAEKDSDERVWDVLD